MIEYVMLISIIFMPIVVGLCKVCDGWFFGFEFKHDKKHGYCMYLYLGKFGVFIGVFYER